MGIPGLEPQLARGRDAALGLGDRLDRERRLGGRRAPASRRAVHRRRPGVRRLAARSSKRSRSTPAQPVTAAARRPLGLHPRPLLDVQLEVGAEPVLRAAPHSPARGRARPRSRPGPRRSPGPRRRARPASALRVERAGEGRAAEQAAAEARALLVGPVDEHQRRAAGAARRRPRAQDAERRHRRRAPRRASRRRGPSRGASRAPAPARRIGALESRPQVAGLVDLAARARARPAAAEQGARLAPGPATSTARWAPRSSEVRRASSRRSAITRAGSIAGAGGHRQPAGSRSSACARQWAPPPPLREHRQVRVVDLEPERAQLLVELRRAGGRDHPLVAERDRVDAELERVGGGRPRGSRSPSRAARRRARRTPTRRRPRPASAPGSRRARRCGRTGPGSARCAPPSPRPRSSRRAGGRPRPRPLLAVADQHHARLDDASRRRPRATRR